MRILSYNILDGGTDRAELLTRVIESRHPDVVALVEADDPDFVESLAGRLGMDFVYAPGGAHGSALLSRYPIAETVNHALLRAGAVENSFPEATVIEPGGAELPIGVVHLHARPYEADEAVRERELEVVLDAFARHRAAGRPHLLCGDFNANSPHQRIDPARCKEKTRLAWEANGGDLPRRVVRRLLEAGYVDTLHAFDPAAAETHATFTTDEPGQRVDYVFAYGIEPARIRSAAVITNPPANEASDHFPVLLDVDLAGE